MSFFTGHRAKRPRPIEEAPDSLPAGAGQPAGWQALPEALQLVLAQEAMRRAAATLADQAELLAHEMDAGTLVDHGGPDALRLFAAIIRSTNAHAPGPVGHA